MELGHPVFIGFKMRKRYKLKLRWLWTAAFALCALCSAIGGMVFKLDTEQRGREYVDETPANKDIEFSIGGELTNGNWSGIHSHDVENRKAEIGKLLRNARQRKLIDEQREVGVSRNERRGAITLRIQHTMQQRSS